MNYTPRPDSLAFRVCEYFRRHDTDELGREDIALKFEVRSAGIDSLLEAATAAKHLTRSKRGRGDVVYCAGPALKSATEAPRTLPAAGPWPAPATKRPPAALPPIDAAAIAVECTLPIPSSATWRRQGSQWAPLLERMTKPGQHSGLIPKAYNGGLRTATAKWVKTHGGKFSVLAVSDTHLRIWRVA